MPQSYRKTVERLRRRAEEWYRFITGAPRERRLGLDKWMLLHGFAKADTAGMHDLAHGAWAVSQQKHCTAFVSDPKWKHTTQWLPLQAHMYADDGAIREEIIANLWGGTPHTPERRSLFLECLDPK